MIKQATTFLCALFLACCAQTAAAQNRNDAPPSQPATPAAAQQSSNQNSQTVSTDDADLVITSHVTARELRFDVVPNPTVEFTGKQERQTEWSAERENLPRPVQPGVTYRDIGIRLKIVSRFADIDRIVAEALGEVPVTDDVPVNDKLPPPAENSTPEKTSEPASPSSSTDKPSPSEAARQP